MLTNKGFVRGLGVFLLLLTALGLMVSPSAALGSASGGGLAALNPDPGLHLPEGGSPGPGGPGYVSVSGMAFHPYSPNLNYVYAASMLVNTGVTAQLFSAPIQLPHGASVTKLVV